MPKYLSTYHFLFIALIIFCVLSMFGILSITRNITHLWLRYGLRILGLLLILYLALSMFAIGFLG